MNGNSSPYIILKVEQL